MVKNLPAIQETHVWFLGREDPLVKEMATHFNILAWKTLWTEELGKLQSMESQRVGHNWAIVTHTTHSMRLSTFHMLIDLCPLVKCLFKFCPFFYWVDCLFCIFWIQVICWMHCKNILGKKLFFSVFELWYMPLYWTPVSELMYYFILFIHFIIVHLSVWCIFFHSPGYRQGARDAAQIKVDHHCLHGVDQASFTVPMTFLDLTCGLLLVPPPDQTNQQSKCMRGHQCDSHASTSW